MVMSLNINVRRSERLREKAGAKTDPRPIRIGPSKDVDKSTMNCPEPMNPHGSKCSISNISKGNTKVSSKESRRCQAKLENELKKKEIEQELLQKKHEMLDLELKLKLVELDTESDESGKSEFSESTYPDVEEWINGRNPWEKRSLCSSKNKNNEVISNKTSKKVSNLKSDPNQLIHPNQLAKVLTRQSMPTDLPNFTGNPLDWPNWFFQYKNSTNICGFSQEENHWRLQKCLKGNALKIVESLLIMPQNVDKIICILESRFGQTQHIIFMLLEKVKSFPFVKEERLDLLIHFSDEVKNLVGTLESLNDEDNLRNPTLLHDLLNKLPNSYKMMWVEYISNKKTRNPKLVEFNLWLDTKSMAACQIEMPKFDYSPVSRPNHQKSILATSEKKCISCHNEIHYLNTCPTFKNLSLNEKWDFITVNHICISCLVPYHSIRECKRKRICGINNCQKYHNRLLHKTENFNIQSTQQTQITPIEDKSIETSTTISQKMSNELERNCHISTNKCTLLKILPVNIIYNDKSITTYALLDDASTVTLINEELADCLDLQGSIHPLCLQWTNESQVQEQKNSKVVSFSIKAEGEEKVFQIRHARTVKGLLLSGQTVNSGELSKKYAYINNRGHSFIDGRPQIIIGQDNWPLLVSRKIISGQWDGPALSKTLLGWVIHGNISYSSKSDNQINSKLVYYIDNDEKDDLDLLHNLVKEQWHIESIGIDNLSKSMSKEDIRAQNILENTMKRIGNKFETGLLWKNDDISFPDSKNTALRRLSFIENKMDKNPDYGKVYCEKMDDLLKKGYIRKISEKEKQESNSKIWYLPHFSVVNPNKPNKLRIVFDAASRVNGVCLNDFLLTGPDLYNSLVTILLNFRIKKFAFTADIKEMFLQVQVRNQDCKAQRFLWRGLERSRPPAVYEINVVFFGSKNGPCLAQEAKNRNAREFEKDYPLAVDAIIKDHYMDDYLGNSDTIEEGKTLINDIIYIHSRGGFNICNWISNSQEILDNIEPSLRAYPGNDHNEDRENSTERVLGVYWNHIKDNFIFETKFHKINKDVFETTRRPTKREILKVVMSVFDPYGFLSNFIIQGKILLKEVWRSQLGWDDEITETLFEQWQVWLHDLKCINKFTIPRMYFSLSREKSDLQLHIFCDASERAYASVAYLRCEENTTVQTAFVMSKTRVSPLKPTSIPRLELQASLMGARLGCYLIKNLKININNIIYWTDSKTVLYWLRSEALRFKVFVAQRIGEIQSLTNVANWHYINTTENVADEATKRKHNLDFSENSRWLFGPTFLHLSPENWPIEKNDNLNLDTDILEEKKEFVYLSVEKPHIPVPSPENISKWTILLRSTAWMKRFITNCKKSVSSKKKDELEVEEMLEAEKLLYKKIQQDSFHEEIRCLQKNIPIRKDSRLYTLSPMLDRDGIIRLNGRLQNLPKDCENIKLPIILDPTHKITFLIIKHYHEQVYHHGQETVINNLRQKFWILRMRQAVKTIWAKCQICKNRTTVPTVPIMGQLPTCRIEPTVRPFIKTGVDYFGPILVTVKRSHEKRYGVIFTCMVTRAVHLEIANDLSTDGFIHVLRQFSCRRGNPEEIYSDNGTCFKSADKELRIALLELKQTDIIKWCSLRNIKWHFNPPSAPFMGGAWERLIQTIKKVMKEILQSRYPQEYVLRTIFAEAENILNSRPLTHVSCDSDDMEALTPNHFLIGPSYAALPCIKSTEKDLNLLNKWKAAQKITDIFWKRWTQEYMPFLIKRSKWHDEALTLEVGNIVLIVDPNGPRNTWPKGRIVQIFPARDGKIRTVDVKLANGMVLRRPTSKLCILDVTS